MILTPKEAGFIDVREVEDFGKIGVRQFFYSVGLCCHVNLDIIEMPFRYRYCYDNLCDCLADFYLWDGKGSPSGNWIKEKNPFTGDHWNPHYVSQNEAENMRCPNCESNISFGYLMENEIESGDVFESPCCKVGLRYIESEEDSLYHGNSRQLEIADD